MCTHIKVALFCTIIFIIFENNIKHAVHGCSWMVGSKRKQRKENINKASILWHHSAPPIHIQQKLNLCSIPYHILTNSCSCRFLHDSPMTIHSVVSNQVQIPKHWTQVSYRPYPTSHFCTLYFTPYTQANFSPKKDNKIYVVLLILKYKPFYVLLYFHLSRMWMGYFLLLLE